MKFVTPLLLSIFCISAYAKDFNNGCGSGWNEPLVPDRIGFLCVDFAQACAKHDNCYSKCLEGGENYGKPICEQSSDDQKEGRRSVCDKNFSDEMRQGCDSCDEIRKPICIGISALYAMGVKKGGKGFFNGREVPDSYYDFIASERAIDFDFDSFVEEVNSVQNIDSIRENNNLIIKMENGFPAAEFRSINQNAVPQLNSQGTAYKIESIRYGNIDLSNASDGEKLISADELNLQDLDMQKLESIQKFVPVER